MTRGGDPTERVELHCAMETDGERKGVSSGF